MKAPKTGKLLKPYTSWSNVSGPNRSGLKNERFVLTCKNKAFREFTFGGLAAGTCLCRSLV